MGCISTSFIVLNKVQQSFGTAYPNSMNIYRMSFMHCLVVLCFSAHFFSALTNSISFFSSSNETLLGEELEDSNNWASLISPPLRLVSSSRLMSSSLCSECIRTSSSFVGGTSAQSLLLFSSMSFPWETAAVTDNADTSLRRCLPPES